MLSSEGQSGLMTKLLALVSVSASKLPLTLALYICYCHFYSFTFDISPDLGLEQLALATLSMGLIKMHTAQHLFMDKMCFKLINQLFCCLLFSV